MQRVWNENSPWKILIQGIRLWPVPVKVSNIYLCSYEEKNATSQIGSQFSKDMKSI